MTDFVLTPLDLAIIFGSIAAVVALGLWVARRPTETARDYFLASGRLPWWIIGAAFVSTSVSSEQIVGTIGGAYQHGMGIANWEWWSLPTYIILISVFIPIYLKNRIATVPELLSRRFSLQCGGIYSSIMLIAYVFVFLVPVLYGGSLTLAELTGIDFFIVLWTMSLLIAVYTVKGGLISVMWTDALQCLMLVGGGLILYFVALRAIPGGWSAMAAANPERFHLYRPPDDPLAPFPSLIAGTLGLFIFYHAANQVMIQRVLGARSVWHGIMGIIFAGFINLLRPLVTCFLGFIVYHWIHEMKMAPPLENFDLAFPFALKTFSPGWGLRGIVLAGFLAAVMSTVSALANSSSTLFALDVYRRLINPSAGEHQVVRVGRIATFVAIIVAALLAPLVERFGGIFVYFQTGVTYVATPFISVILLGLFWRRTNTPGALFGLLGGIVIQIVVALMPGLLRWMGYVDEDFSLHWIYLAAIAEVIIICGVVVVSLLTPPPPAEKWQPFLWRPSVLREVTASDTPRPWYAWLRLWFAVFAVIWFAIYWRFW